MTDRIASTIIRISFRAMVWLSVKVMMWPLKGAMWAGAQGWHRVTPLMTPRRGSEPQRPLERQMFARNLAGIVFAGAAFAYWRSQDRLSLPDILYYWMQGIFRSALVAAVALCLSGLILLGLHRRESRIALLKRLCRPLALVAGYCAGVILPLAAFSAIEKRVNSSGFVLGALLITVLLVGMAFWCGALVRATLLAGQHYFRAEEVHPALLSFCLTCVGGWALLSGVWSLIQAGTNSHYPVWVAILLGLLGPATIVILAGRDLVQQNAFGVLRGPTQNMFDAPLLEIADAD